MKKRFLVITTLIITLLLAAPVVTTAEEGKGIVSRLEGLSFGLGYGFSTGGNINVGYRIPSDNFANRFGFRGDINLWEPFGGIYEGWPIGKVKDIEIRDYHRPWGPDGPIKLTNEITAQDLELKSAKAKGNTYGVLVDFYPVPKTWLAGGFRISGGYYFGEFRSEPYITVVGGEVVQKFKIEDDAIEPYSVSIDVPGSNPVPGKAIPKVSGLDNIGGVRITDDINAKPKVIAHSMGPYAGIGWDFGPAASKLKMTVDVGVVFTKDHEISLTEDNINNKLSLELLDADGKSIDVFTIRTEMDKGDRKRIEGKVADIQKAIDDAYKKANDQLEELLAKYPELGGYGLTKEDFKFEGLGEDMEASVDTKTFIKNNPDVLAEIDKSIADARKKIDGDNGAIQRANNNRIKDNGLYGLFPMFKIGFLWRF